MKAESYLGCWFDIENPKYIKQTVLILLQPLDATHSTLLAPSHVLIHIFASFGRHGQCFKMIVCFISPINFECQKKQFILLKCEIARKLFCIAVNEIGKMQI